VTKGFGQIQALSPVSFEVGAGEFVSIVGPSGCGKSTLLRLASRLERPTSGVITRATERIGYVFQEPTLMPWRTVRHNVELLAELDGMDKAQRRERTESILRLVGLDEFAEHHPSALSGGMKMRASLARSLLLDPELFLFDEPFGALDQMSRHRLNAELMTLFAERRFASLFVTHSVEEAVYLSSRLLVMSSRPGRLVAEIDIPFPYPRDLSLRYEPEFASIAGGVAATLAEAA
jgi:NitT/TauT family transport system ATP-binding protein